MVRVPSELQMPPPAASLATGPPATLSLTVVRISVRLPRFWMPAPDAPANAQKPPGQCGQSSSCSGDCGNRVSVGTARLPLITASLIVSVAPGASKSAPPTRTSMPPPAVAKTPSPTRPPVIFTPASFTVGGVASPASPTVTTGPPPLIVVAPAPAPTTLTLLVIVTPPANVPAEILIVSPSREASSAAWSVR